MFGIDDDGTVVFATEHFATLLETTVEVVQGRDVAAIVAAEDRDAFRTAVRAVRDDTDRRVSSCDLNLRRDSEHVPVTLDFTAGDDGLVVCAAEERAASTDRFRHLFDHIHDAAVLFEIVELTPIVRAVNPSFVETFGVDATEIIGESLNEHIVPDTQVSEATDYDQRTARGKANYDIVSRKSVDGRREFIYRGLPFESDDGRRYGFAVYTDVTDDRRRQRRLRVLHRVLRHNLRNDLSVVFGMAEFVQEADTDEAITDAATRVLNAAERLDSVSEQAREIEHALDGRVERPVDAAAVARSVAVDYRDRAPIETAVPDAVAVTGGVALYDALDELVENAVEHTPDGTPVRISLGLDEDEAVLSVSDEGDGIPAVERAAVFEDENITNLQHGSGLGVWLARWVAEVAGGEIEYDRRGNWTIVSLRLPVSDADDVIVPDVDSTALAHD